MTLQITADLEQQLRHLAAESNSTPDELAQHAIEEFVAYRLDLNEAARLGDEDFAAGRVLEHSEVVARIEKLLESKGA